MIKIALLGSTGSIGKQVLNVVDRYPQKFQIVSMAAGSNAALFTQQINKYKPQIASFSNAERVSEITSVPTGTTLYYGENAIMHAVTESADIVFDAVMGYAGLNAVKKAIELKKNVALANKETLVCGGEIIMPMARKNGVKIIPVDSEHSAIFQCLDFNSDRKYKKIILTASGGAVRNVPIDKLDSVNPNDALLHPNWLMGKKITVDCATMVNKGFEVMEAMWLFNAKREDVGVVIHKESIVHSMVAFDDGAVIAQMGLPSMELPIQLALTYPERLPIENNALNLINKTLTFDEVDINRYPCFEICNVAINKAYNYPCALSAADEEVVKLFLEGKIKYTEIPIYLDYVLQKTEKLEVNFENLEHTDKVSRSLVYDYYLKRGSL